MPLARPIVHQTQPTPVCCTATCIAMAVGTPVADLGVGLDSAYGLLDFGVYLAERGVWLRYLDRGERFWSGSLYLLSVRSLDKVGVDHALLLDTRDCTCERPPIGSGSLASRRAAVPSVLSRSVVLTSSSKCAEA